MRLHERRFSQKQRFFIRKWMQASVDGRNFDDPNQLKKDYFRLYAQYGMSMEEFESLRLSIAAICKEDLMSEGYTP